MNIIEAIILGLIQGLTEFLPVSSSGHIELGSALLGAGASDDLFFSILVHGATALSTIVVFRKDILEILSGLLKFEYNESWQFAIKILISMVPIAIVGLLFEKQIESFFGGNTLFVGLMLLVTGFLLTTTFYAGKRTGHVTRTKAFLIGIAQTIAILPGISRSGSTIAVALLLGVEKSEATRFSFLMVLIPILGGALLKAISFANDPAAAVEIPVPSLVAGFIAAFVAGLIACSWMINIVRKGKLIYFALYCFIIGTIAIVISF